jgi:hypothetical protein
MIILVMSKHYPQNDRDPSGIFVKRWIEDLEAEGHSCDFFMSKEDDLIAAHWLWPAGVLGAFYSFWSRKPLYLVLYGDPYMIEKHWWVRIPAWFICKQAKTIQVISTPCYEIMSKFCGKEKLVLLPCH